VGGGFKLPETEQLVAEYGTSGLSQVEFCRKQGLSLATLARYRKRQAQGNPAAGNRWVEVKESTGRPGLDGGASGLAVAFIRLHPIRRTGPLH
jgi:hypothetical protein